MQSQLRAARAGYPATFAATVIAASAVLWSAPLRLTTNFAAAILCIVALLSLNRWREERRVDWCFADPRGAILTFARLSFVTALGWGVLMALLAATPDGPESLLATFRTIGVKTVVALTAASGPLAGLAFLRGSCIGAALTIVFGHLPPRIVVALVVFMILFARSILVQANLFIVNNQAELDLATATLERIEAKL
ncbi:hypothetical protein [uncultured Sphingomonas sp.]|uniref:hypothetical protein n=1 Tax=uncultured Sphingomonas sp. TaxID=158754 RepID=UPI0025E34952|nr:hypothetical protein [uncultured Sphingomonas sp.]